MKGIAVEHAPLDAQDATGAQNPSRTQRGGAQNLSWSAATARRGRLMRRHRGIVAWRIVRT